ncbi:DUF1573 domain-containing protein [Nonlabens ponticola]|uniref:DUF1573 domain-containing protein n=1 Tax=Nonlabens ponticola TaxID=2496866 RepID=A0A3S9N0V1_9FLAO|nr:DUF1573 domain-containing protein [Nonlabens ponticola]AZQ45037.1 DUF1573 domain-containing protein [Nonlabens ponticola]
MYLNLKYLIIIVVCLSGTQSMTAQNKVSDELTTIVFEQKTIDYGTIEKGSDGEREFIFTNTGEHDFILKNIFSSCNCDVISKPEEPIAPGTKGKILVIYDTKKVGPIVKTMTIMGNIKEKVIALKLTGVVKEG